VSALFILAYVAEPLWYFVIFFCALHSPRHLASEYQRASARQRLIALGVMSFFTLVTVGVMLMIGERYYVELKSLEALTYQAIFIGLSVLTIPHMCLMEWTRAQRVSASLGVTSSR
jgi:Brp/Blh family beta-carotene 15,15'-monooxygenase